MIWADWVDCCVNGDVGYSQVYHLAYQKRSCQPLKSLHHCELKKKMRKPWVSYLGIKYECNLGWNKKSLVPTNAINSSKQGQ